MPCTTIELGDAQIEPGNPRYPLNVGVAPWERIKRSAAASSSSVLTPGRILPATRSSVAAWIAPAAAIFSISSGDFLMIIPGAYLPHSLGLAPGESPGSQSDGKALQLLLPE